MNPEIINQFRVRSGPYASDNSYGFTGAFLVPFKYVMPSGKTMTIRLKVIASDARESLEDGLPPWEHVSVSLHDAPQTTPTWEMMCHIKNLWWNDEAWVVQYHPPKSQYINNHAGCLHLWRPCGEKLPTPPQCMVGDPDFNLPK